MHDFRIRRTTAVALGSVLGLASTTWQSQDATAANTSASIVVAASVAEECTLVTENINISFGVYNDAQITKDAAIEFNCPEGSSLTFTITGGSTVDGLRQLPNITNGGDPLLYFFRDQNLQSWDNGLDVTNTGNGLDSVAFQAVLLSNQLSSVSSGDFHQTLTLNMTVN